MLVFMTKLMSCASEDFLVLSFVLPCAYAYIVNEDQVRLTV